MVRQVTGLPPKDVRVLERRGSYLSLPEGTIYVNQKFSNWLCLAQVTVGISTTDRGQLRVG